VAQSYRVYRDRDGFSERALYVVDADGVIRYSHVSPFLNHVPEHRELLGALDGRVALTGTSRGVMEGHMLGTLIDDYPAQAKRSRPPRAPVWYTARRGARRPR